ncbi:MAG: DNA recombination protein RmuC [Candidatus Nanopelagicales bacterium]
MISVSLPWVVLMVVIAAAGCVLAYRLGAASLRPTVLSLREQLVAREEVAQSVTPLREAMSDLQRRVDDAERSRVDSLSRLSEQMLGVGRQVSVATDEVRTEAQRIAGALSRTQHQGLWGEMQLRRIVEASGMLPHVHFVEQVNLADGTLRPDMVVDLGESRCVVVDAKVSLDALLDPRLDGDEQAAAHASAISDHLTRLSAKQYWKAAGSPEFVIMFLPAEHMLGIALQARPDLLQASFDKRVVLATPTTLMATLRSVSWAWQQAHMAGQARQVLEAGQQVHQRLTTMSRHIAKLGKDLGDAVDGYNQFVGSLDARVLPASRRLSAMCAPDEEPTAINTIDIRPRDAVTHDTG